VGLSDDQKAMLRLLAQREQGYDDIAALSGSSVEEVRAKVKGALDALDGELSQDQKAMLRLLAQREEGYEDIAALTGAGVEDVRGRVRAALTGLEGDSPAPAAEPPKPPEPAAPKPTSDPPKAEKPPVKAKPSPHPAPKPARKPSPAARSAGVKLPEDPNVRRALAGAAAVVGILALLLLTGVIGGDDDGGGGDQATTAGGNAPAQEVKLPGGKQPTQAVLSAVDGSDATGQALFGRSGQHVILLLSAKGLQPSPKGQSYTVSLVRSEDQRLPLLATEATDTGIISGRFQIAPQVLGLLAGGFDEMEVSLVDDQVLRAALAQARKSEKAPDYDGTPVLSGPVTGPIVEAGEG
jgi:hypothetical protein